MRQTHFHLLTVVDDVEPILVGPYATEHERNVAAKVIREVAQDPPGGIYPVDLTIHFENMDQFISYDLDISTYSGGFFDPVCDICGAPADETHLPACANHIERQGERHD